MKSSVPERVYHQERTLKIAQQQQFQMNVTGIYLVQFWTPLPSPVTQRRGERVQDHLSAHARRLVSFLANGYCACVHQAWQYGGSFEGIG